MNINRLSEFLNPEQVDTFYFALSFNFGNFTYKFQNPLWIKYATDVRVFFSISFKQFKELDGTKLDNGEYKKIQRYL